MADFKNAELLPENEFNEKMSIFQVKILNYILHL